MSSLANKIKGVTLKVKDAIKGDKDTSNDTSTKNGSDEHGKHGTIVSTASGDTIHTSVIGLADAVATTRPRRSTYSDSSNTSSGPGISTNNAATNTSLAFGGATRGSHHSSTKKKLDPGYKYVGESGLDGADEIGTPVLATAANSTPSEFREAHGLEVQPSADGESHKEQIERNLPSVKDDLLKYGPGNK
ncbi:hypothetical protein MMC12_005321 [Toensbergia leucococca]|nr:hypothetical protein [Toensbergia leucococca]